MMKETENVVHTSLDFLPLKSYTNIIEGNALKIDWEQVVPKNDLNYIMGNPLFIGYAYQTAEQKNDIQNVTAGVGKNMDYVTAWYFKAARLIQNSSVETAFVSTNSITQGEQVAVVWKPLIHKYGISIRFAWRTFKWNSESKEKAAVHCVIIGFQFGKTSRKKKLFVNEQIVKETNHISPYLIDSLDIFVERRKKPLYDVPDMVRGSQTTDDGNLILTEREKDVLLKAEPQAACYIRPFMMGKDFINRKPRYCLWLAGVNPAELKKCPRILERVERVREFRLKSRKSATRNKANTPWLFDEIRDCKTDYIAIPKVSSENRRYIPILYLKAEIIAGDKLFMMPEASLFEFGVLTSNVHMAWMRAVSGRLKSDYSYSNTIVYNNFRWCSPSCEQKEKIRQTAQLILDARALYPDNSLADLYDEVLMPPELRKAHQQNDKAVMQAYGFSIKDTTEAGCVAKLMKLYQTKCEEQKSG